MNCCAGPRERKKYFPNSLDDDDTDATNRNELQINSKGGKCFRAVHFLYRCDLSVDGVTRGYYALRPGDRVHTKHKPLFRRRRSPPVRAANNTNTIRLSISSHHWVVSVERLTFNRETKVPNAVLNCLNLLHMRNYVQTQFSNASRRRDTAYLAVRCVRACVCSTENSLHLRSDKSNL